MTTSTGSWRSDGLSIGRLGSIVPTLTIGVQRRCIVAYSPGGCIGRLASYALVVILLLGGLSMVGNGLGVSKPGPGSSQPGPVPTMTPVPAERIAADMGAALDSLISVGARFLLVGGIMGLSLVFLVVPARLAFSQSLGGDVLALVQSVTGHWAPEQQPGFEIPATQKQPAGIERAAELEQMVTFCKAALVAGSWSYQQMRGAGWQGGARRWQGLMDKVAADGFAMRVNNGKTSKWEGKGIRPFHSALSHYGSAFLDLGRAP